MQISLQCFLLFVLTLENCPFVPPNKILGKDKQKQSDKQFHTQIPIWGSLQQQQNSLRAISFFTRHRGMLIKCRICPPAFPILFYALQCWNCLLPQKYIFLQRVKAQAVNLREDMKFTAAMILQITSISDKVGLIASS